MMKKLLLLLLCLATVIISGCGDKFAKEKKCLYWSNRIRPGSLRPPRKITPGTRQA